MARKRIDPVGAGPNQLDHPGLGVGALGLADHGAHAVSRHSPLDEHDESVEPGDPGPPERQRVDVELELVPASGTLCRGLGFHPL